MAERRKGKPPGKPQNKFLRKTRGQLNRPKGRYGSFGELIQDGANLFIHRKEGKDLPLADAKPDAIRAGLLLLQKGDRVTYKLAAKGSKPRKLERVFLERFTRTQTEWLAYCDELLAALSSGDDGAAACLHVLDNPNPLLTVFDRKDVGSKVVSLFAGLRAMMTHKSMIKRTKHLIIKLTNGQVMQQLARGPQLQLILDKLEKEATLTLCDSVIVVALEAKGQLSKLCLALAKHLEAKAKKPSGQGLFSRLVGLTTSTDDTQPYLTMVIRLFEAALGADSMRAGTDMVLSQQELQAAALKGPRHLLDLLPHIPRSGGYASVDDHLNTLFELHRADSLWSLQEGMHNLTQGKLDHRDMATFVSLELEKVYIPKDGLEAGLFLQVALVPCLPPSNPNASALLTFGNLLCITDTSNAKPALWVTVVERVNSPRPTRVQPHPKWSVVVALRSELGEATFSQALDMLTTSNGTCFALQSPTFYQAHAPITERLKSMTESDVPYPATLSLGKTLYPSTDLPPWCHPEKQAVITLDATCLTKHGTQPFGRMTIANMLKLLQTTLLDSYQQLALGRAFREPVSIIQGVPGGGKSFLGVLLVQLLLSMQDSEGRLLVNTPLLVLTYKNHALDEFTKDCDEARVGRVVRFGGGGDETVEHLHSSHLFKQHRADDAARASQGLVRSDAQDVADRLKDLLHTIRQSNSVNVDTVRERASTAQLRSLIAGHLKAKGSSKAKGKSKKTSKKPSASSQDASIDDYPELNSIERALLTDCLDDSVEDSELIKSVSHDMFTEAFKAWTKKVQFYVSKHNPLLQTLLQMVPEAALIDAEAARILEDQDAKDEEERRRAAMGSAGRSKLKYMSNIPFNSKNSLDNSVPELAKGVLRDWSDLWTMDNSQRAQYLSILQLQRLEGVQSELDAACEELEMLLQAAREQKALHKAQVLQAHTKVVGMTVTGACIQMDIVKALKPQIVLFEEAAEITEPQMIACLHGDLQHLLLIGDHQQLPPQVQAYDLEQRCNLNCSLMERLVASKHMFATLWTQNRMHPQLSRHLLHIYPKLRDNLKRVNQNSLLPCVQAPGKADEGVLAMLSSMVSGKQPLGVIWWHCEALEQANRGYQNTEESRRACALAGYYVVQGVKPENIAILTGYRSQRRRLVQDLTTVAAKHPELGLLDELGALHVRVETVDRFQGDESQVVILSLTRSNTEGRLGFMASVNRHCVALSRAKAALIIIGDARIFGTHETWKSTVEKLKGDGGVTEGLVLSCTRHPKQSKVAHDATQAEEILGSPCLHSCSQVLACCTASPQHICARRCHQGNCASRCIQEVVKVCPKCHNTFSSKCCDAATATCQRKCQNKLSCGHDCHNVCGEPCMQQRDCMHRIQVKCAERKHDCTVDCGLPVADRVCSKRCSKLLSCGHPCGAQCSQPCSTLCKVEDVTNPWKCAKCGIEKVLPCNEVASYQCKEHCTLELACGHPCARSCADMCLDEACPLCIHEHNAEQELQRSKARSLRADKLDGFKQELKMKLEQIKASPYTVTSLVCNSDADVVEYLRVKDLVERSIQPEHGSLLTVKAIQRISNPKLEAALRKYQLEHLCKGNVNTMELFHGTGAAAIEAIAENGFRLPKPGDHNMFGRGIYFASNSSKAAQEVYTKQSQKLLVCEVYLGKTCTIEGMQADHALKRHQKPSTSHPGKHYLDVDESKVARYGYQAVFGKRDTREAGGVMFDEYIVFNPAQAVPKYIVEFERTGFQGSGWNVSCSKPFELQRLPGVTRYISDTPEEKAYRYAESQYYRMTEGVSGFGKIKSITLIHNQNLQAAFDKRRASLSKSDRDNVILAFHGSSEQSIEKIARENFDIARLASGSGDNGWYGAGIYFSEFPSTARSYAKTTAEGTVKVLLSKVLVGKAYDCPDRMDGAPCKDGYHSHRSPDKEEIVIFGQDHILPYFVVEL
eukprot:m.2836 g.2836  ORF g.2836 m.2836 type:complete len:1937 (-) comp4132_c0_seq1:121-5931(-)